MAAHRILVNEGLYLAGRKHDVQGSVVGSMRNDLSGYLGPLSAEPLTSEEKGDAKDAIYHDEVALQCLACTAGRHRLFQRQLEWF